MSPEARFDWVLDSFAGVERFRATQRERVPDWPRDLAFIEEATALLAEDERIAVRAGETKNRMRDQGRKDFGLINGIFYETARAVLSHNRVI